MKSYKVTFINGQNEMMTETWTALSIQHLQAELSERNLWLVSAQKIRHFNVTLFQNKMTIQKEKASFYRDISLLLKAGTRIDDAFMDVVQDQHHPTLSPIIKELGKKLRQGNSISQAMSSTSIFTSFDQSVIEIGESTGHLDESFYHLSQFIEWQHQQKEKLRKTLFYPCILLISTLLCMIAMVHFVLPSVLDLLSQQHQGDLPFATRSLIYLSKVDVVFVLGLFFPMTGMYLLIKLIGFYVPHVVVKANSCFLGLPIIGPLLKGIDIVNFLKGFDTCLASHVPLLQSLDQATNLVKQPSIKEKLKKVPSLIRSGQSIQQSVATTNIMGAVTKHLLSLGEKTGSLGSQVKSCIVYESEHLNKLIERCTRWIAPLCISLIASMLLWMILAIIDPMYDSLPKME